MTGYPRQQPQRRQDQDQLQHLLALNFLLSGHTMRVDSAKLGLQDAHLSMRTQPIKLTGYLPPELYQWFQHFKEAGGFTSDSEALSALMQKAQQAVSLSSEQISTQARLDALETQVQDLSRELFHLKQWLQTPPPPDLPASPVTPSALGQGQQPLQAERLYQVWSHLAETQMGSEAITGHPVEIHTLAVALDVPLEQLLAFLSETSMEGLHLIPGEKQNYQIGESCAWSLTFHPQEPFPAPPPVQDPLLNALLHLQEPLDYDLFDYDLTRLPSLQPQEPLTQRQLSEITGIPTHTLQTNKSRQDFPSWIQQRSPQGFAYRYSEDDNLFYPLPSTFNAPEAKAWDASTPETPGDWQSPHPEAQ